MRAKATWLSGVIMMVALALAFASTSAAQTTSKVEMKNFEVIAVNGNKLVFRDQTGTREITVPDDFRFTIDGKKMAVSELKPGMKGTATVTTTTTVTPVFVTEVREGQVLRASDLSMVVRGADGNTRRFTQSELDKRGIEIVKDGKAVRISDIKRGDTLSAIIITAAAPAVLTEQEVQATLAEPPAQPAPATVAAAAAPAPAAPAAAPAAAAPAAPAPTTPAASPAPSPPPSQPAASSGLSMTTWLLIAIAVAVVLFFFLRRRKEA